MPDDEKSARLAWFQPMDKYPMSTVDDFAMKVFGVGILDLLYPSREKPIVLTLDKVLLVEAMVSDLFLLRAIHKAGHKF